MHSFKLSSDKDKTIAEFNKKLMVQTLSVHLYIHFLNQKDTTET